MLSWYDKKHFSQESKWNEFKSSIKLSAACNILSHDINLVNSNSEGDELIFLHLAAFLVLIHSSWNSFLAMKNVWNIKCYLVRKIQQSSSSFAYSWLALRAVRTTRWSGDESWKEEENKYRRNIRNGMKIKLILFMNIFSFFHWSIIILTLTVKEQQQLSSLTHYLVRCHKKIYLLKLFSSFSFFHQTYLIKLKWKLFYVRLKLSIFLSFFFFLCASVETNIFPTQTAHSIYKIRINFSFFFSNMKRWRSTSLSKKELKMKIIWKNFHNFSHGLPQKMHSIFF